MASNSLGSILRLSTFGESHGPALGGVIDGVPAGIKLDLDIIRYELSRRRPGQSHLTTARNEQDEFELLSGLFEGFTTGAPIGFIFRNSDQRSKDYDALKNVYRPSHADRTYQEKYGIRDHKGGGRSSARETVNWVLAGAIARQLLPPEVQIHAWVDQVGSLRANSNYLELDFKSIEDSAIRCPDKNIAPQMERLIESIRDEGDSVGGAVRCLSTALPPGLGAPIFSKLQARLGAALFSLNAVKGVEFGRGFEAASMRGSEHNDTYDSSGKPASNQAGGVLGGISNGQDLDVRIAFKPTATISKEQNTIDKDGKSVKLAAKGRHDPCVVPRAVPIVEALTAFTLADLFLMTRTDRL
jgi:chorismate synthase